MKHFNLLIKEEILISQKVGKHERMAQMIEGAKAILETRGYEMAGGVVEDDEAEAVRIQGVRKVEDQEENELIVIQIPYEESVGIKAVRNFKKYLEESGIEKGILLAIEKYTHYAKAGCEKEGIETFSVKFPFFNLFEHNLVPLHEFATEEEIQELKETYSLELYQLPKITIDDPAAQLLGAKIGQVIKIIRKSPTAGTHIVYRYVVLEAEEMI
ncbi:MAG: DNA-directed RNA polymerase subunit H [Candidatus Hermodarchaeota archaeon]